MREYQSKGKLPLMAPEDSLRKEHLKNLYGGLTFEASVRIEETTIDKKAEKPKRNLVRKRSLRTARPERSRKRT